MADAKARRLAARYAINSRWATATESDRQRQHRAMEEGKRAKAVAAIDPEGRLTPDQLEKRLEAHKKAAMARLTLRRIQGQAGR